MSAENMFCLTVALALLEIIGVLKSIVRIPIQDLYWAPNIKNCLK